MSMQEAATIEVEAEPRSQAELTLATMRLGRDHREGLRRRLEGRLAAESAAGIEVQLRAIALMRLDDDSQAGNRRQGSGPSGTPREDHLRIA